MYEATRASNSLTPLSNRGQELGQFHSEQFSVFYIMQTGEHHNAAVGSASRGHLTATAIPQSMSQ